MLVQRCIFQNIYKEHLQHLMYIFEQIIKKKVIYLRCFVLLHIAPRLLCPLRLGGVNVAVYNISDKSDVSLWRIFYFRFHFVYRNTLIHLLDSLHEFICCCCCCVFHKFSNVYVSTAKSNSSPLKWGKKYPHRSTSRACFVTSI